MQDDLHHRELVEIRVEQRSDDHDYGTASIVTGPRRTARRPVCRPCYPNAGPTIAKPPAALPGRAAVRHTRPVGESLLRAAIN
ncbi:hypothetical protein E2P84_24080 [Burkholderia cepacia]|uniref:Uncharacterized protein n=1 Tax=Burkholderia cepacia TaxID=292 RepID=A0AAX2RJH3_BURCE|nr:hypothetical protein EJ998_05690 [Burkholderia cepacia ATCC 25416]TES72533.1 hypothetical protein E2P84_24080 [Burkholderia cepacia]THJ54384.1 hypothetical protein E9536_12615 [Burkholderia sp. LS-044]TET04466.1 hypothetical protein E3D36_05875 [Burkholderia cepacia]TEU33552.1 hypothetical protein E3D39_33055 [Burkholderia cepacia]